MKKNILIFSNFNSMKDSNFWKSNSGDFNLNFETIYDSNFTSFKKLNLSNISGVFVLVYLNDIFNIEYLKVGNFFVNLIKSRKDLLFNFIFIKKNLNNYQIDKVNNFKFINLLNKFKSKNLANLKISIMSYSPDQNFNLRNEIITKMPFEFFFLEKLAKKIINEIKYITQINKQFKIIFLDCDNTLWGGIAGEDGNNNIEYSSGDFGVVYENFQKHLLNLKKQGFILSIVSKNDEKTVWDALKKRNMVLKKNDFILPKINWSDKSLNIKQTLSELNLRPADALFIDDHYLELLKVSKKIKAISVIDSSDIIKCFEKLISHPRLQKKQILKEDLKKFKQYVIKDKFLQLSQSNIDDQKLYKKLKQKLYFEKVNKSNIFRAEQLFNKTNQFNISLNRKTTREIFNLNRKKNTSILLLGLRDKYGDHGLIGLYVISREGKLPTITDFLLSCRVLDRHIEYFVLAKMFKKFNTKEIEFSYNRVSVNKSLIDKFFSKLLNKNKNNIFKNKFQKIKIKYQSFLSNYEKFFVK